MTDLWKTIKGQKQAPRERNYFQVEEFQESALDYERRGVGIYDQDLRLTSTIDTQGGEKTMQRTLEAAERRTLPPTEAFKMKMNEFHQSYTDVLKITDMEMDELLARIQNLRFLTYKNPSVYLLAFVVFRRKGMLDEVESIADEQDIPMSLIVKYIRHFEMN